jgi:transcriptional regulator with XRE-family HTH domain
MARQETSKFIHWLNRELSSRGWSDNQLARQAGISHSVISRARSGHLPKWEACEALAVALGLPAELVFRKAGLLPLETGDDLHLDEWKYVLARLTEKDRCELLRIARIKLEMQGGE